MRHRTLSERALVLAPHGRDASVAAAVLSEADVGHHICPNLPNLVEQLNNGAGLVLVTEEALSAGALGPLAQWLDGQREWSDLPFILLTRRGGGLERNPTARRYLEVLGNVTFWSGPSTRRRSSVSPMPRCAGGGGSMKRAPGSTRCTRARIIIAMRSSSIRRSPGRRGRMASSTMWRGGGLTGPARRVG